MNDRKMAAGERNPENDVFLAVYGSDSCRKYRLLSTLKADREKETWLCEDTDGKRVIVKASCTEEETALLLNEESFLRQISRTDSPMKENFPEVLGSCPEEQIEIFRETDCDILRVLILTYIPGRSLQEYVESEMASPGIDRKNAIRFTLGVLEQLSFLHSLSPPIIHRDIKPQNVILGEDGKIHLIDFDISRIKRQSNTADTLLMGTSQYAPPEQYGFRETDERSDIFAVGVLLRYCLTQESTEEADEEIDADLRRIIRKAARFDPDRRYSSAKQMYRALLLAGKRPVSGKRAEKLRPVFFFAAVFLLLVPFLAWEYMGSRKNQPEETAETVSFREPLIEAAIRAQLGLEEGLLTREALAEVTSLHIFGRQIYQREDEFWFLGEFVFPYSAKLQDCALYLENGGIRDLSDLLLLPNLKEVFLYRQEITDISVLADLPLTGVGIGYNPLTDLSPVFGKSSLTRLNVACLPIEDADGISTLKNLEELCISGTGITRLAPLSSLRLRTLNLADVTFEDEEVLAGFSELKKLTLSKLYPGLLSTLSEIRLQDLEVTHTWQVRLRDLEVLPSLERLVYTRTDGEETVTAQPPLSFPNMRRLDLKGVRLESLECLSEMKGLTLLGIYESECGSYEGLQELYNLKTVLANPQQREKLKKYYPDSAWEITD